MDIAFTIPEWLLWIVGVAVGICTIGLAILGVMFLVFLKDFKLF